MGPPGLEPGTNELLNEQNLLCEYRESHFKNVVLIGRSTGKLFFMNDVLIDAHNKILNGHARMIDVRG